MKLMSLVLVLLSSVLGASAFASEGDGSLPLNPVPGQCYIHKFYPATYATEDVTVTIKEAYKTFELIPATFEIEKRQIPIRDKYENFSFTQPTFKSAEEKVRVFPPDPTWQVNCCGEWKKKGHSSKKSCEEACFKLNQAQYKDLKKHLVDKPGASSAYMVPEEFATVEFKKLKTPPQLKVIDHPAVTTVVKVKKLLQPGYMKWEEGTCGKYTCDPKELRGALKEKGYFAGPVNGDITPEVIEAMNKFRTDNNLGLHDELDQQTATALGIVGYNRQ